MIDASTISATTAAYCPGTRHRRRAARRNRTDENATLPLGPWEGL